MQARSIPIRCKGVKTGGEKCNTLLGKFLDSGQVEYTTGSSKVVIRIESGEMECKDCNSIHVVGNKEK